ncbi:unnamed protein product [Linum trigynum]|uniref:Myb/SANT-like domain-containing protein n=1 Tax=Linum trigynum TaxID=586398 RepID=A0AAV2FRQ5_9ROSI
MIRGITSLILLARIFAIILYNRFTHEIGLKFFRVSAFRTLGTKETAVALIPLENMMLERSPGCGVKVEPNIHSRHKKLKKDCHAVQLLRNQSGCGWNNVTKTPTLDDDVFEALIKVHPNCKNLNRKSFPFYDELLKVFGKVGPADGRKVAGITDVVDSPIVDGPFFVDVDDIQTPIDVEGPGIESFMEDLINEGIEISQRAAVTPPAQPTQGASNSEMKKKAIKKDNKTDNAIVVVAEELGD